MLVEIRDIYKYQKEVPAPMLSNHTADYWAPYRNNYTYYDRIFKKKYASFFPFDQEGDVEDVAADFSDDVKAWLMMNDKRYAELFRINTIQDDEKYSLTDNVYEHEVIEKDTSSSGTNIKGSETITDTTENIYGSQIITEDMEKVHGQQLVEVDGTITQGAGEKNTENSTSAYNDSGYEPTDKTVETEEARTETTNMDTTHGAHTDTEDNSITHGAHTDNLSNTRVDGQRTDTVNGTGSEDIERTRSGNIGVRTVDEMLDIHKNMWVDFSFYDLIFSEIARELLRGCA